MTNGEIFFARYPITIDVNAPGTDIFDVLTSVFPPADFDIISSETVPISGENATTNAVMLVIARAKT